MSASEWCWRLVGVQHIWSRFLPLPLCGACPFVGTVAFFVLNNKLLSHTHKNKKKTPRRRIKTIKIPVAYQQMPHTAFRSKGRHAQGTLAHRCGGRSSRRARRIEEAERGAATQHRRRTVRARVALGGRHQRKLNLVRAQRRPESGMVAEGGWRCARRVARRRRAAGGGAKGHHAHAGDRRGGRGAA